MSTEYIIQVYQNREELKILQKTDLHLHIAFATSSSSSTPVFDLVHRGDLAMATQEVKWTKHYAVNWVAERPPRPNAITKFDGNWQTCSLGQSYDLTTDNKWAFRHNNPHADPGAINIGSNSYKKPVHLVLGVRNPPSEEWKPIWISETPLAEGAHFEYRPYMVIKLWYQEDYRSPLVIDEIKTPEQKFDKGNNSRVVYFSYNPKEGKWRPPQFTPPA